MAKQHGGNRRRRFSRLTKAYDETRINDSARPRFDEREQERWIRYDEHEEDRRDQRKEE